LRAPDLNESITCRLRNERTWVVDEVEHAIGVARPVGFGLLLGLELAAGVANEDGLIALPCRLEAEIVVDAPSVRNTRVVNGARWRSVPEPGVKSLFSSRSSQGESTGGNAEEAATARASDMVGALTSPTR
jgi:hypothetical protein